MIRLYDDGLTIDLYTLEDNDEALALDRAAAQGGAFRLSFHRRTFHRRAENFTDHLLFTGRIEGRLVALAAVGFKDVVIQSETLRAGFAFDLRVHPDFQRRGIGRRIARDATDYARSMATIGYSWVIDDNRAAKAVLGMLDAEVVGSYRYLVYPTYRRLRARHVASEASFDETHTNMLEVEGPFDLYTDPRRGGNLEAYVGSWIVRDGNDIAGCSAWDNRNILGEVVEALPLRLRMARALFEGPLLRGAELPHIPEPGEQLRSWYLFDAFATRPDLAVDLMRHVTDCARQHDIDYCHLAHIDSQTWVAAVRAEVPKMFAPELRYLMLAGWDRPEPFPQLEKIYVDIRDL
jgi:GNAT superfamily N-acetyltransferase